MVPGATRSSLRKEFAVMSNLFNLLQEKQYDFEPYQNELIEVEAAGRCIRVGIKDSSGRAFSWWEPAYPFVPPPPGMVFPEQNGWQFGVEVPSDTEARAIFTKGQTRHVLTVKIEDANVKPMPVTLTWE